MDSRSSLRMDSWKEGWWWCAAMCDGCLSNAFNLPPARVTEHMSLDFFASPDATYNGRCADTTRCSPRTTLGTAFKPLSDFCWKGFQRQKGFFFPISPRVISSINVMDPTTFLFWEALGDQRIRYGRNCIPVSGACM